MKVTKQASEASPKFQNRPIGTTIHEISCNCYILLFQSLLDFAVSVFLLLSTLTMKNRYKVHSQGIVAWIECRIWNSKLFLWVFFVSSTWNTVVLTIEI